MSRRKINFIADVCIAVSNMGTCNRKKVGAVFYNDDYEILTSGYNGSPRGFDHCNDKGCIIENGHCVATTHAEQNAIVQAAKNGISLKDSNIFVTLFPCFTCTKLLINLGVKSITYIVEYLSEDTDRNKEYFKKAKIKVNKYER